MATVTALRERRGLVAIELDGAPWRAVPVSAAAEAWLKGQDASGYFTSDLSALSAASSQVWPEWGSGQFSQEAIWAATVKPGLTQGKSIVSMLPAWQDSIVKHAKSNGYKVEQ